LPGNTASKTKGTIVILANPPPPDRSEESPMAGQGEPADFGNAVLDVLIDMLEESRVIVDDIRETLK
jgi:hypothetical protein